MKFKTLFKWSLIYGMSYISVACSHQPLTLQTVFSSNDCGINKPELRAINTAIELDSFMQSIPGNFLQVAPVVLDVDHEKQTLILYALGQKPSSGYTIELHRKNARLEKQTLYLPARVKQPEEGYYQAQLITSPCSIYSLPHVDYSEIVIE